MTDEEYTAFLSLMICSDPWPTTDDTEQDILEAFADREAAKRGYADWVHAYHGTWKTPLKEIKQCPTDGRREVVNSATLTLSPEPFEIIVHGALKRGLPPTRDDPGEPPSVTIDRVIVKGIDEGNVQEILDAICPGWQTEAEKELLDQAPTKADESDDKYDALKSEGKL